MDIISTLQYAFDQHCITALSLTPDDLTGHQCIVNLDPSKQEFGDMSSNIALILAKKQNKNPRVIAQELAHTFKHPLIANIELAGPGFINFTFHVELFHQLAQDIFTKQKSFFREANHLPKKINIEFVSANPTGPLHLGHGRGGIIGDVLGNVLAFLGDTVTKEYYINDAGIQINKLGASFKARCLQACGQQAEVPEDGYQGHYLVDMAKLCLDEVGLQLATRPDEFFEQYAKDHILKQLQITLANYGINHDIWFSEKSLHDSSAVQDAIDTLSAYGYTYVADDALWFASTRFGDDKDRVLKKSSGEYTYVAADVAYMINKFKREYDKLVMILGQDHHSYVVRLKGIAQALGYNPDNLEVILYQLVTLKQTGELVRMSKRAGNIVTVDDIIDTVGTDVARFFYLNKKASAHLEFDLELALKQTEENPVFYIQYAYVRTKSILSKAQGHSAFSHIAASDTHGMSQAEALLLKKIYHLKNILQTISSSYQTHLLAHYVIDLCQEFHRYYAHHKVIDLQNEPVSRSRLMLVAILCQTLDLSLSLLGISLPEKM